MRASLGSYNIYCMSIRNALWDDSPLRKPFLQFHPQILKHDIQNDPEQLGLRASAVPQEPIPPLIKLNPGPLSPWSAYITPHNERISGGRVPVALFREDGEGEEGIVDRLNYSAEEGRDMATPIQQRQQLSGLEECDNHTTAKKSECVPPRKRRPKEKGLRQLSQRVYAIIQELQRASYKEVAARLVAELGRQQQQRDEREEQNIKRRVYDALNVLISLGVLVKDGRKITRSRNKLLKPHVHSKEQEIQQLQQQAALRWAALQQKQKKLQLAEEKKRLIQGLLQRNRWRPQVARRIEFPFIGLLINEQSLKRSSPNEHSLLVESPEPMQLFGDIDSIKWLQHAPH